MPCDAEMRHHAARCHASTACEVCDRCEESSFEQGNAMEVPMKVTELATCLLNMDCTAGQLSKNSSTDTLRHACVSFPECYG